MNLSTIKYTEYEKNLPQNGNHIIGQSRGDNLIVYQAFNPKIASYAVQNQKFGGSHYKFSRMSWIKPNFLWMMYRAGWASKEGQEKILAIEISKANFIILLKEAIHSSYKQSVYDSHENWKNKLEESNVRLQWDPDHDPYGNKLERRAIQIGIKGELLNQFATTWIKSIQDITPFVKEQESKLSKKKLNELLVIEEEIIQIDDLEIKTKLELK